MVTNRRKKVSPYTVIINILEKETRGNNAYIINNGRRVNQAAKIVVGSSNNLPAHVSVGGGGGRIGNRRSQGERAEFSLAIVLESRGAGRAEPSRAEIEIALRDSQTARINANNWILPAISVSLERRAAQLRNAPRRRLRASKVDRLWRRTKLG